MPKLTASTDVSNFLAAADKAAARTAIDSVGLGEPIEFENGSRLREGLTDAGNGGAGGIALVCSLDYEFKWEAGRLYVMGQDGFTIRTEMFGFTAVPTTTDDDTKGYVVGSRRILDSGVSYTCTDSTTDAAIWIETPIDHIPFDTAGGTLDALGQVAWDADEETLAVVLKNDTLLQVGEETLYHVENVTGSTIDKGTPVMYAGTTGNSGKLQVQPWDGTSPKAFLGIATSDIPDEDTGYVTHFGKAKGFQTNGANYGETWASGEIIYAVSGSSDLTNVAPTTGGYVIVAVVIAAHASNGTLFVRPTEVPTALEVGALPLAGGTMDAGADINFANGSRLREGLTDAGNGGAGGIALVCSLDYEFKWEAGRLYVMEQDGFTIRTEMFGFTAVPTTTDDDTKGYIVGSRRILDDGTVYLCTDATEDTAVWVDVTAIKIEGGGIVVTGTTNPTASGANTGVDSFISGNYNYSNSGNFCQIGGYYNYSNTGNYCQIGGNNNYSNSGNYCQISGSSNHTNSGSYCSISGSNNHTNSGSYCSISGSSNYSNTGDYCSISGSGNYSNSGNYCSISGDGNYNNTGNYCQIGGYNNDSNSGSYCSISGYNNYSNTGGYCQISGSGNYSNSGTHCQISGSSNHTNSGSYCSISGSSNYSNTGSYCSISGSSNYSNSGNNCQIGGYYNHSNTGSYCQISGYYNYSNTGSYCSISGYNNYSNSGNNCQIGGYYNHTNSGNYCSISGRYNYSNSGNNCSISGDSNHSNSGNNCSISGTNESNSGNYCSISGFNNYSNTGNYCSISGRYNYSNSGNYCSISGSYNYSNSGIYCQISGQNIQSNTGSYCSISGYGHQSNSGSYCQISGGYAINNTLSFARVHGGGIAVRIIDVVAKTATTDDTPTTLTLGGAAEDGTNRINIPADSTWSFTATVVARETGSANAKTWTRRGLIGNDAGTVTISSLDTIGTDHVLGTLAASIAITADDTNDALKIEGTGIAATNIQWTAQVNITQVG